MVLSQGRAGRWHLPAVRDRVGTLGSPPEPSRQAAILSASEVRVVALFVLLRSNIVPEHDATLCAGTQLHSACPAGPGAALPQDPLRKLKGEMPSAI